MNTGVSGEKTKQIRFLFPVCVAVVTFAATGVTPAREVLVGGGASVGYEFDDRQYDDEVPADQEQQDEIDTETDNRDERYSRLRLAPLITLTSSAPRDEVKLRYSPSFWYDFEDSDNNVDHDVFASLSRYLDKNWQVIVADQYLLTDQHLSSEDTTEEAAATTDATATEDSVRLSDTDNRRRYWTNDLSLRSIYGYAPDSSLSLGYSYNILKNIDTDEIRTYEDFDRHEVGGEVGHRFDPVWKLLVAGSYVRGLYEEAESDRLPADVEISEDEKDLDEYRAGTLLQAALLESHLYLLGYNYYSVEYDAEERNDSSLHDITLGWQWSISKDTVLALGAGPTYIESDNRDGEWEYNANMLLGYSFERGYLRLTGRRGYEVLNFTGTGEDNGLREYWLANVKIGYRLHDNLSAELYTGYRYEDQEETRDTAGLTGTADGESDSLSETETFNRKRFSSGASLGYTFQKWYKMVLSYDYTRQDSELIDDSFDEHRVGLTFSFETELFKW